MHLMVLSCKTAAALIDKKLMFKLTWRENVQLHVHSSICEACKSFQKQSKVLDSVLNQHIRNADDLKITSLTNHELKNKIKTNLSKNEN